VQRQSCEGRLRAPLRLQGVQQAKIDVVILNGCVRRQRPDQGHTGSQFIDQVDLERPAGFPLPGVPAIFVAAVIAVMAVVTYLVP
jgi:hypothetical protein